MIVPIRVFATMQHVTVKWVSLEMIVQSVLVQTNVQLKENVLTGHVFVMLDSWELIVHSRDVLVDVDQINIAMMVHALVIQDSQEPFVIFEHAPMIVLDMVIALTDLVIVVLDGLLMIVL